MSQILDEIKTEVNNYRKEIDIKREREAALLEQKIEADRVLLENSGIKQIFEEVRDSGLIKLRSKNIRERGWLYKILHKDQENELDYIPAEIVDNSIYISLRFDEGRNGCSEVRIAAIGGRLNIAHGYNRVDYTPIEDNELAQAIIDGIKNPLRVNVRYGSPRKK